jgi:CBS domain-containing protein
MEIDTLMTPVVLRVEASETLAAAARRMWAHEVGALPVFDRDELVGIITERDLVAAVAMHTSPNAAVAARMSPRPATARLGEEPSTVAMRMLDLGVRYLPVLDGERVAGVLSAGDLLALVAWPTRAQVEPVAESA